MSVPDHVPTTQERLAKAEERNRKAAKHADRLRRVATAEAEVPGVWATGDKNLSKEKLAEHYGVSAATITRILERAGVPQTRIRRLTDEERKEIETLLRGGSSSLEIQEAYDISHNTVRKIGLNAGIFRPGEKRPQRTDAEYENIKELDELARQRFGAGIYLLGVGLRNWEKKKRDEAKSGHPNPEGAPPEEGPVNEGSVAQALHQAEAQPVDTAGPRPEPAHTEADAQPGYPTSQPFDPATEPAPAPVTPPQPSEEGGFKF